MIEQLAAFFATDRPLFFLLAGPNGAGKSTFRQRYANPADFPCIDPDELARQRFGRDPVNSQESLEASKDAARVVESMLQRGESLGLETVFSDSRGQKLELLKLAKAKGYQVGVIFIGLDDPQLSIARVMDRVDNGGHDVPDELIVDRFPRVFANLKLAIPICDFILLVDNSEDARHRIFGSITTREGVRIWDKTPRWFDQYELGKLGKAQ
jgi:predicted ABC-type ATPase